MDALTLDLPLEKQRRLFATATGTGLDGFVLALRRLRWAEKAAAKS